MSSFSAVPNSVRSRRSGPSTRACSASHAACSRAHVVQATTSRACRDVHPVSRRASRSSSTSAASASSVCELVEALTRIVELEQALGVERRRSAPRAAASYDARTGSSSSARRRPTRPRRPSSALIASTRPSSRCDVVAPRRRPSLATRLGSPRLDLGTRERVVGEPLLHPEAVGADGGEQVAAVGCARGVDDARDGADVEARVAAADLAPALDEHDSEPAVAARGTSRQARGSAARRGAAAAARAGNSTVPSGNIGIALAITPATAPARPSGTCAHVIRRRSRQLARRGGCAAAAAACSPPSPGSDCASRRARARPRRTARAARAAPRGRRAGSA